MNDFQKHLQEVIVGVTCLYLTVDRLPTSGISATTMDLSYLFAN